MKVECPIDGGSDKPGGVFSSGGAIWRCVVPVTITTGVAVLGGTFTLAISTSQRIAVLEAHREAVMQRLERLDNKLDRILEEGLNAK